MSQRSPKPYRHGSAAPSPCRTDPGARRQAVCDIVRNRTGARDSLNGTRSGRPACPTTARGTSTQGERLYERATLAPGEVGADSDAVLTVRTFSWGVAPYVRPFHLTRSPNAPIPSHAAWSADRLSRVRVRRLSGDRAVF